MPDSIVAVWYAGGERAHPRKFEVPRSSANGGEEGVGWIDTAWPGWMDTHMAVACHILTLEYSVEGSQFEDRIDFKEYISASFMISVQMACIVGSHTRI